MSPTWYDDFDLPDASYSVLEIHDYFGYSIKNHETIANNPPVQIYTNKIKNSIDFKIKTDYKLELISPETLLLFLKIIRRYKKRC